MPFAPRLLITAGPTHEPIDSVRYIANRSSGRMGIALADAAAARGWPTTLLLGPTSLMPSDPQVRLHRFRTTADLQALLSEFAPHCDILIMAAAVADYTPQLPSTPGGAGVQPAIGSSAKPPPAKLKRSASPISLTLHPTPDLLAGIAVHKRPDQCFIGFALEPEVTLLASAREKLARKGVDMIIANPLETMDSPSVRATLLTAHGEITPPGGSKAEMSKDAFAAWLLDQVTPR